MKPFKILRLIFQVCAAALFLATLVIVALDGPTSTASDVETTAAPLATTKGAIANLSFLSFLIGFVGTFALATVGIFLVSSPQDTASRVGHGFVISSYAIGLAAALMYIENSTAAIVMLIAVIALALYYLCILILKIMQKGYAETKSPNEDIRIVHVKEWKKVMEEGIISPEEYEEKRCQILGIKPKKEEAKELK